MHLHYYILCFTDEKKSKIARVAAGWGQWYKKRESVAMTGFVYFLEVPSYIYIMLVFVFPHEI